VFVATGAFDCGKTTTLERLREHHGVRIHAEAHLGVLARLGERTAGHPPGQPFSPITSPDHFCPMGPARGSGRSARSSSLSSGARGLSTPS
jgi:hypothetical protein